MADWTHASETPVRAEDAHHVAFRLFRSPLVPTVPASEPAGMIDHTLQLRFVSDPELKQFKELRAMLAQLEADLKALADRRAAIESERASWADNPPSDLAGRMAQTHADLADIDRRQQAKKADRDTVGMAVLKYVKPLTARMEAAAAKVKCELRAAICQQRDEALEAVAVKCGALLDKALHAQSVVNILDKGDTIAAAARRLMAA